MEPKHLCLTCANEFPTCEGKEILWGEDIRPNGSDQAFADMVIQCDGYTPKEQHEKD
jgi:hypothetical protein